MDREMLVRMCMYTCDEDVSKDIKSEPPENVITIPEGATNGDVFKAIYPGLANSNLDLVDVLFNTKSWWNSPYKLEGRK